MNRRWLAPLTAGLLLALAAASADLPQKWSSWRYWRQLSPSASDVANAAAAQFTVPWELFSHCAPGCMDLRLIDQSGAEIPFLLNTQSSPRPANSERNARILENSFVAGQYTQVVGDLGSESDFDRVTVQTSRSDFLVWTEVALSDDGRTWRTVEPHAPIARFRSRSIEGTQTLSIHALGSRYIRLRISNPPEKFPVNGLLVSRAEEPSASRSEVHFNFAESASAQPVESVFEASLASPNQPHSEVRLQTDTAEFYRGIRVAGSKDGQEWSYFGSGFVYRYKQGDKIRELLAVEYPEVSGYRRIRVEVINGDDQPLRNVTLRCAALARTIALRYTPGTRYRLLYGNDKAGHGQYDLANYFHVSAEAQPILTLSVGPEEITGNYRDPRPFTERHPGLLWVALGIAILLVGLTAVKTLRSATKPAGEA
jgi:hypothetical protein